jgi:hypothetical protein
MNGNRRVQIGLVVLALLLLMASTAQGDAGFTLTWWSVDGGGGVSAGGNFTLAGAVGQHDAAISNGGDFALRGGFWVSFIEWTRPYLPLVQH